MTFSALPSTSDFDTVFKTPDSKAGNPDFLILARHSSILGHHRLGFVTSKKKIKRAVDRNRFRRVIRNCLRHNYPESSSIDYVVVARKVPANLWTNQFGIDTTKTIHRLFRKLESNDLQR